MNNFEYNLSTVHEQAYFVQYKYNISSIHGQAYFVQYKYSVWTTLSTVKSQFMDRFI